MAYQVRGANTDVRSVAINTSDGPRHLGFVVPGAEASLSQPPVISRAAWGADESYRFKADGTEDWPQAFYATRKLIVHHTATANDDPDPAATVRAIYRYHAIDRAFGDIGYNFLIDWQGRIYKGRYSGSLGTRDADTPTGEDVNGLGVTAAHTGGWNSGTMGVAILGDFTTAAVPPAARQALIDHLAWEAEHHGIDPLASDPFTNPVSGAQATTPNISGHRDWAATECPGGTLYADLPSIRTDVAAEVSGAPAPTPTPSPPPTADTVAPSAPSNLVASAGRRSITLGWHASTDTGGSGLGGYEIWRSQTSATSGFSETATTANTTYTDGGRKSGKTYWYYVRAYDNAANTSAPSNTVSAKAA